MCNKELKIHQKNEKKYREKEYSPVCVDKI